MIKEISIGLGLAIIVFMFLQGINILPFTLIAGLILFLFYLNDIKGLSNKFNIVNTNQREKQGIEFEQIGGQATAKKELIEALEFIKNPDVIKAMGIRPIKGLLLTGPPGTGKTLLAKAAASYTDSIFISAAGSEFIEMYAGVGAQRIRQLFKQARSRAKKEQKNSAILFIDEIDILGAKRGTHGNHLEYDQTLNQLLVEMDGLNINDGIFILIIAATNRDDILDKALTRPGRFDRIVQVGLPDLESRLHILMLHIKNKPIDPDVNLKAIAKETFGFSGAHLETLTNEAAILAMREKEKQIKQQHFIEAIDKVIMGEKIDRYANKEERWRIAVHETGHAIVSEYIRPRSVSLITTAPRGQALGYMRQSPEKDSYLFTKEHLEGKIAILLGGSVSEQLILGNRSTGAVNDFQQAIEISKKIISAGLSPLGVVSMNDIPGHILHRNIGKIITQQEEKVVKLLKSYIIILKEIAGILLEQEKISGNFLREKLKFGKNKLSL